MAELRRIDDDALVLPLNRRRVARLAIGGGALGLGAGSLLVAAPAASRRSYGTVPFEVVMAVAVVVLLGMGAYWLTLFLRDKPGLVFDPVGVHRRSTTITWKRVSLIAEEVRYVKRREMCFLVISPSQGKPITIDERILCVTVREVLSLICGWATRHGRAHLVHAGDGALAQVPESLDWDAVRPREDTDPLRP